jgi:hypothetical protein
LAAKKTTKIPKLGFFGRKFVCHLATLISGALGFRQSADSPHTFAEARPPLPK